MSLIESLKTWKPSQFTLGEHGSTTPCAVVILNQPLENRDLFVGVCTRGTLCNKKDKRGQPGLTPLLAKIIVCADGGANQLYDLGLMGEEQTICVGHFTMKPHVHEH